MQPFDHFSHFAAFWFRNDDAGSLKSAQEAPRDSAWLPGIRKAVQRLSAMAGLADAA